MVNIQLRKGTRPYELLEYIALGSGVLIVSLAAPKLGTKMAKYLMRYMRKRSIDAHHLIRDLKNLQNRNMIRYQELESGKVKITITKQGKQKVLLSRVEGIQLKKSIEWDKQWRLVMFDIPDVYKKASEALRIKLNQMQFYPIQKSVFITPYPCEEEIDFIGSFFNIRNYILLLYVSHFEGEEKLKSYFKI
jgi:hypothetical protein